MAADEAPPADQAGHWQASERRGDTCHHNRRRHREGAKPPDQVPGQGIGNMVPDEGFQLRAHQMGTRPAMAADVPCLHPGGKGVADVREHHAPEAVQPLPKADRINTLEPPKDGLCGERIREHEGVLERMLDGEPKS